ncbi:MAG: hypothetical protein HWE39_10065 [Oceanospirillaceae bacterium]|nr:hypothetical protein [Oceanospirillaceae bacterium]
MATFNRIATPPNANTSEMRAYMQALLEVSGMMAGQAFPLGLFMKNFKTHLEPKRSYPYAVLIKSGELYSLTPEGVGFFSSRLTSSPVVSGQKVSREEVLSMTRKILQAEPPEGWLQFQVDLPENQ